MNLHRPTAILEYIWSRVGKLTVIGLGGFYQEKSGKRVQLWKCLCDCGKEIEVPPFRITHKIIKSCGCARLKPFGEMMLHRRFCSYRADASKKAKKDFRLTFEEFKAIVSKNCAYCNSPPSHEIKAGAISVFYGGVDRVDPSKGYTLDNTVPCCTFCNMIKWILSKEDFLKHIEKISNYQKYKTNLAAEVQNGD
jgi:hypothetical protein